MYPGGEPAGVWGWTGLCVPEVSLQGGRGALWDLWPRPPTQQGCEDRETEGQRLRDRLREPGRGEVGGCM